MSAKLRGRYKCQRHKGLRATHARVRRTVGPECRRVAGWHLAVADSAECTICGSEEMGLAICGAAVATSSTWEWGGVGGLLGGCVSCSPRLPMNACLSAIRGRASSRQPGARRRTRRQRAVAHRGARRVEGDDGEQRRRHHQHQRHAPPPREPARAQHVSNTPPQGRAREAGRARPGARGRTRWYAVARGVRTRAPGARPPPPRASRSHTPKGPPSFG